MNISNTSQVLFIKPHAKDTFDQMLSVSISQRLQKVNNELLDGIEFVLKVVLQRVVI